MSKIGIFYGTTTGVTEEIAHKISKKLEDSEVLDIAGNEDKLENYDVLLLGTSTWGFGDLQDDWQVILGDLSKLNLKGKKVGFFGTGDCSTFSDTFLDGIGILYEEIIKTGATIIGQIGIEGYEFSESRALLNGKFVGLGIDEVNEADLTDERIENWVELIKEQI